VTVGEHVIAHGAVRKITAVSGGEVRCLRAKRPLRRGEVKYDQDGIFSITDLSRIRLRDWLDFKEGNNILTSHIDATDDGA
jgi:hypothetical protein